MKKHHTEARRLSSLAGSAAICLVSLLPLAGCMSSGASSFADGLTPTDTSITGTVPLNVASASSGIVDGRTQNSQAPTRLALLDEPTASDTALARSSLAGEQAELLARQNEAPAKAEYAALAPVDAGASDALLNPVSPERAVSDEELAAQARIPALFDGIDHGQCKGGWGPKPKMINARRMNDGDPYYMEMRMRHTPPLPIGHVYIAYGKLGPDGEPLDERLIMLAPVGGYAGAGMAGAIPMPGLMKPVSTDCAIEPVAAYRISLTAQKYEKLLQRIVQAKKEKPSYHLFAHNCNHFMSEIAASVGVLPPKNQQTASLQYFYEMMDRNEGRKVARGPGGSQQVAANFTPATR
ncbi:MAG: hypothetical protein WBO55_13415 [Rhizobiaceae bacterium]